MRNGLQGIGTDRSGASALEFALLAPLFFSVAFSTFEAGWLMTRSTLLDRAVSQVVRLVRVADPQAPKTQTEFKQAICDEAMIIPDCINAITVEMTEVTSAAAFPTSSVSCVDRGAQVQPVVAYKEGGRASIMYVRVCAVADPFTPGIGFALSLPTDSKGGYSLVSTAAFMNEPV